MRSILILAAATALSAEAPPPPDLQQYDQALSTYNFVAARQIVDRLLHERVPADGKPRPDPLLNAMIGRLYLTAHEPAVAAIYLDQAPIAELPPSMRAETALEHGRTLDLRGDRIAALQAYRDAAAASQSDDQRRRAAVRIASDLLPQDPALTQTQMQSIANGPSVPQRWEARYLLAASSSLLGDGASARQWADQAWADAASAPLEDLAPLRVEVLRAGLAAAANETLTERAMVTAANGLGATATTWLPAQLPVCGDSGLTPSDFVIFGFTSGPFEARQLVPIAASRAAAVGPFVTTLGGTSPVNQATGESPLGTVFTARCRMVVSPYFFAKQPDVDPLTRWAVEHGLYWASAFNEADDDHFAAVQHWIDALTRRFGADSPLLIMPRWQLLTIMEARAVTGESVLPGEMNAIRSQVASGLTRAGAPDWLLAVLEAPTQFEKLAKAAEGGSRRDGKVEELFQKQLLRMPFDVARAQVTALLGAVHGEWPAPAARLVVELDSAPHASLSGRDRQAWALMLAGAQRSLGHDAEAKAALRAAGISPQVCAANDSEPKLVEQHFSYDDYPPELTAGDQEGGVLFEYGLSPAGTPTNPRILYSLPSGLFDRVSSKGLATLRYKAPTRNGAAVSCEGVTQPIKWQLEDSSDYSPPSLSTTVLAPGD